MKKILLFLTVLLLWAGSSWAQTTVTIGAGTSTSYFYGPIYRSSAASAFDFSKYDFLITAAELATAGVPSGATITKVAWYKSSAFATTGGAKYDIWIKNSAATTLTSPQTWGAVKTGATLAYTSTTQAIPTTVGWIEFPLTTTLTYTGGALEIAPDWDISLVSGNPATGAFNWNYTSGLAFNGTIGWASSTVGSDASSLATGSYGGTLRPNIQITYTGGAACSGTPDPGNTISSSNPACSGVTFTLSLQNSTPGSGVTYQWQTSPDGNDPWTNAAGTAPSFATTQTTATWYRCQVTCAGNTGTSTPLQVTMNSFLNCYCASAAGNAPDEEIYSVTVGGNTNAYNCTTVAPGPGSVLNMYSNFTTLGSLCNLPQSGNVPFTILEDECDGATYYSNGCAIWVDFNQDGDFTDAGEQVYSEAVTTISPRTITGTIAVPAGAILGVTRMRITVAEGYNGATLTPCLAYGYGETEDYLVTITVPPACAQPYNLSAAPYNSTSANLNWTAGAGNTSWEYVIGVSPVPMPAGAGLPTSSSTTNPVAVSPQTTYQYWVRGSCGGGLYSPWSTYTFTTPCLVVSTFPWSEGWETGYTDAATIGGCWSQEAVGANFWKANSIQTTYNRTPRTGAFNATLIYSSNAWLFRPFTLQPCKSYKFSMYARQDMTVETTIEVKYGATNTSAAMTTTIIPSTVIVNGDYQLLTGYFTVPAAGDYYIGVHGIMGGTPWYISIDDLMLEENLDVGTLQGYVYEQPACTTPLKGAKVQSGAFSALTDITGYYQICGIPSGTYNFTASMTGYVDQTINGIVISNGGTTNQDFCIDPFLAPPSGLLATVTGPSLNDVHLSWMAPGSLPPAQWIFWDTGLTPTNSVGTNSAANFSVASRWPVADIAPFNGMYLKEVKFWPAEASTICTYTIKVWQGVSPPTEIYSFTIPGASIIEDAWNTFTLPTGVLIDGTQEFWFGYNVNTTAGYPAGVDAGPNVEGKGNAMYFNGAWTTLYALAPTLPYNWSIHGWLAQAALGPEPLLPLQEGIQPVPFVTEGNLVAANSASDLVQTPSNIFTGGAGAITDINPEPTPVTPMAPLAPSATLTGYNVYRGLVKIADNVPGLTYDDLALPKGGYDYEVSAKYNTGGESAKVGPVHVDIYTCFPPTALTVPAATTTMVYAKANWTASTITPNPEWIVEYGPKGFAHGAGIGGPQYTDNTFFEMNSLTPGTEYDFYVRTFCTVGDSSIWVKKTFRTHYFDCPGGATAETEVCGTATNDGCNMTVPAFEPLACGETVCGTGWYNGTNRDTDWYQFTLTAPTTVTWSGKAEFSYLLGFIAAPCPASAFIAYSVGAAGTTVTISTTLAAGTYYAFAGPQFSEIAACDSLSKYYATLTCTTDIIPPVITNVVSTPASCTAIAHTVTADITDDISVGAVNIVWTLNGVAQADIPMTLGVAPSYSGVIPAQGSGSVAFHIAASDNATPVNTGNSATIVYQDYYLGALNFTAGPDQMKPINTAATLNATYVQNASCLRITEVTLFSTGTGATSPYPAFMTSGTYDDLVEITNTGTAATQLGGIHLKCEGLRTTDYTFPAATVPAGGVVIVAFGTAANDIPNLYFSTGQTTDVWSSGTNNGIWLTTSGGTIIDAVATNAWTFSVASGVTASDWSGTGATGLSGDAGTRLTGADLNNSTNWVTASTSAQNIGTLNTGVPLTCSASTYTVTWSGGNLPAPVVANPTTTPIFTVPGFYTFTATLSDGICTVSDDMIVDVPVPVTPVADFTVNNTLQTTGGTTSTALFTDLSTNLPDTWSWVITGPGVANFVNSTTPASQNPQVQFSAPGLYTVALSASNTAGSDTKTKVDYISVSIAYCTSIPTSAADEEIFSVTVNGATNAYNCTTVAPGPGSILNRYSNFTTLGSLTAIQQGSTISFTILEDECDGATYYSNGCAIWIDYNQDGIFNEAEEKVYVEVATTVSPRTITGSFVVPPSATLGVTHMRIIVAEGASGAGLTACLAYSFGETEDYLVTIDAAPLTKTLTVKAFIEGLYNGTDLNQAFDDLGPHFAAGIADQVYLELHNDVTYSVIEYPAVPTLVDISTGGVITVNDIPATLSGSYYITIKHRNSIETTSGAAVSFAGPSVSYDFTTASSQAFGDNMRLMGAVYAIWGGDVNQDGIVDSGDMNPVENESTAVTMGYIPEDVNGDGIVDSGDMNIVENNSTAVIMVMTP